jgi:hypothetical protein
MKLKSNIAVSEAGFVFNPLTGESFSVNQTGALVLALIKENTSLEQIHDAIKEHFSSEHHSVEKDLRDFILILKEYNLLENNDKN